MTQKKLPRHARRITTYAEYREVVKAFFEGHFTTVILVGRPGLSKSYEFARQIKAQKSGVIIKGSVSPYRAYQVCWNYQNETLVFDDAEILWSHREGRPLIRALTEMDKPCLVGWEKANPQLAKLGVPTRFRTSSPVALICNEFNFGSRAEYNAIADRSHFIFFDPTPLEVHKAVAKWFRDQQIFDYIGERLDYIPSLSVRCYKRAEEEKAAGMDWRHHIDSADCVAGAARHLLDLEQEKMPVEQRMRIWCEAHNKVRASYYNLKKKLLRSSGGTKLTAAPRVKLPK